MKRTVFERDFFDLHGEEIPQPAPTEAPRYRVVTPRPPEALRFAYAMPLGLRLWLGLMGLFWTIVLGGASLIAISVFGVFLWAAITTL